MFVLLCCLAEGLERVLGREMLLLLLQLD